MKNRILFVAPCEIKHATRFIKLISQAENKKYIFEVYDISENYSSDYCFEGIHRPQYTFFERLLCKIPKLRVVVKSRAKLRSFNDLLKQNQYILVNFHFLPYNINEYVQIIKKEALCCMLTPLGSDVLRLHKKYENGMKQAFRSADYISFRAKSGFGIDLIDKYNIEYSRIVELGYGSETISSILELKDSADKNELLRDFNIVPDSYIIGCGYNAYVEQRHELMLEALAKIKYRLPSNYLIILPLTYGDHSGERIAKLEKMAKDLGLNCKVFDKYLTSTEVAKLRLITDLFIHIQTTDACNGSLQEYLIAGSTCINGAWLKYPLLETDGYPYHIVNDIVSLSAVILKAKNERIPLSDSAKNEIIMNSWNNRIKEWNNFYNKVAEA